MKNLPAPAATRLRGRTSLIDTAAGGAGAVLVWVSAAIHLRLYALGYDHIAVIGWLFLVQGIAGSAVGLLILWFRRLLAYLAGAGYLAASIGGFLTSLWFGLFGFSDSFAAPYAGAAMAVEVAGIVLFLVAAGFWVVSHPGQPFVRR